MNKLRIIYAEDHVNFRVAVARELEAYGVQVIAQASNGRELLDYLHLHPNVILLDLDMPVMNGSQTFDLIMKQRPGSNIIIVSMYYEELLVENYQQRGAKGYITKDTFAGDIEQLAQLIRCVANGETCFLRPPLHRETFSSRQKEMLPMMVEGMTSREISLHTGIGERAVEKQKQKIYQKIGGSKAVDFYRYVFSKGLQFLGRR